MQKIMKQAMVVVPVLLVVVNALVQAGVLNPSAKVLSVVNAVLAALGLGVLHPAVQAKLQK